MLVKQIKVNNDIYLVQLIQTQNNQYKSRIFAMICVFISFLVCLLGKVEIILEQT